MTSTWAVKVIIGDSIEGEWMTGQSFRDVMSLRGLASETAGSPCKQMGAFLPYTARDSDGNEYQAYKAHRFAAVAPWGTITLWAQKES